MTARATGKSGVLPQKKQTTSIKKSKHDGSPPRSTTGIERGKPNRGRSQMHRFRRGGKIAGQKIKCSMGNTHFGGRVRPTTSTPSGRGG